MTLYEMIETINTETALKRIKEDNKAEDQIQFRTRTLNQFKNNIFHVWIKPSTKEFLSSMNHFLPLEKKINYWIHKKTLSEKGQYKNEFTYQGPFLSKYHIGGYILYYNESEVELKVRYGYEQLNSKKQPPKKLTRKEIKYPTKPSTKDNLKNFRKGLKIFLLYITPLIAISNVNSCSKTVEQIKHYKSITKTKEVERKKYETGYKSVQIIHQICTKPGENLAYKIMKEKYP